MCCTNFSAATNTAKKNICPPFRIAVYDSSEQIFNQCLQAIHDIFAQPLIPKDFSFLFSIVDQFSFVLSGKIGYLFQTVPTKKRNYVCCSHFLVSKRNFYSQLLSSLLNFSLPSNLMNLHNCKILVCISFQH